MCEYTSMQAADILATSALVQEQNTHTDIQSQAVSYQDTYSVSPPWIFLSEQPANRHTCRQTVPHKVGGLFSLYVACRESFNMNCQQGKSPILQLCPQRDSGNSRLHYLDFFLCDRKKPATPGEGDEAESGKAQKFRHHHQSLVKGHWQKLWYHLWVTSLEINTATYSTSRASTKAIS